MQRIGTIFIALCMVSIAVAVGVTLYLYAHLSLAEAATVAVAVLTGLAVYNTVTTRVHGRQDVSRQIADLARGTADLARQVAETSRRVAGMEGKVETGGEKARAVVTPLAAEIDELGLLVKDLAEQVAAHETRLAAGGRLPDATAASQPPAPHVVAAPGGVPGAISAGAPAAAAERSNADDLAAPHSSGGYDLAPEIILALIRGAVETNRVDLFLQPIVTLPQRKVRYYEAMSRLRSEAGELVTPTDFLPHAEAGGLMPRIDNLLLFRSAQVARRMLMKNREIGLFCNISASTLADGIIFPQILEFMDANRVLAPSLILEFTQAAVRSMGPIETESLAALASRGFRFSMDNVTDLRMEARDLAERGFRFVKAPAELLLNRAGTALSADIHPADLSDLLGRFGIDLVADKIESEAAVIDLLEHELRYGQGFLFSAPRPIRQEALQGIADRNDVAAVDAGPSTSIAAVAMGAGNDRADKREASRTGGLAQLARPTFAVDAGEGRIRIK